MEKTQLVCPQCGADLIEDAWEEIWEKEDGSMVVDAYPAFVCREKCGYMKRADTAPHIIAQQGNDRLLLLYPGNQGRILDLSDSIIWPPMHVESLLGRGYWEEYMGNHDLEMLLANARDSRAADLSTPNLFKFATSELSQDAFLCWLLSWSQQEYRSLDKELYEAAVNFVSAIFNVHQVPAPIVETIEIKRQFQSLDILAIINHTYAILIEDKTYTKNHSNQLIRYRESVQKAFPELRQLPIYFKIADQSNYRSIYDAKYAPFTRKMMLTIMKKGTEAGIQNPIFLDFYQHLQDIEDSVLSYRTEPLSEWNHYAWQGFYQELQSQINGEWSYVSNPSGGFWAFWWASSRSENYYLQLEQQKLCVKITATDKSESSREFQISSMEEVLSESKANGLQLTKPARLRTGKTMTIAERTDYIQMNDDGTVNVEQTIQELKKY